MSGGGGGAAPNLLDEALWGATDSSGSSATARSGFVLVEDCAETSGGFVLHHLLKRSLTHGAVVLLALAHPFSHYDRVLRKLGCNLSAQRDSGRLHFIDMLKLDFDDSYNGVGNVAENGSVQLFEKIQKAAAAAACMVGETKIFVDDISLLEIAAHGSTDFVLDILHYCATLASEMDCSIVAMNHSDVYSDSDNPSLISNLEYLANVVIRAQPLATGLAADVHGQLTVINKKTNDGHTNLKNKVHNFHFKVKENGVDLFYPGKYI